MAPLTQAAIQPDEIVLRIGPPTDAAPHRGIWLAAAQIFKRRDDAALSTG
jgi:hypothetical protein